MVWPQGSRESFHVPTTEGHNARFINAMQSLLDERDASQISTLAQRLSPFRIDLKHKHALDTVTIEHILVFEENQQHAQSDTLDPTCLSYLTPNRSVYSQGNHDDTTAATREESIFVPMLDTTATHHLSPTLGSLVHRNSTTENESIDMTMDCPDTTQTGECSQETSRTPESISTISDGAMSRPVSGQVSLSADTSNHPLSHWCHDTVDEYYAFDTGLHAETVPAALRHDQEPNSHPTHHAPPSFSSVAITSELQQQEEQPEQSHDDVRKLCQPLLVVSPRMPVTSMLANEAATSTDAPVGQLSPSYERASRMRATSSVVSLDDAAHQRTPSGDRGVPSDDVVQKVMLTAHTCISTQSIQFLEANLARWCRHGLWRNSSPLNMTTSLRGYEKLQKVYSFVCRLDTRMSEDAIRSRMAMVTLHLEYENTWQTKRSKPNDASTSVGRGHTSFIIDSILESVHRNWGECEPGDRAALRTKFHEWKRFGKRWWMLASILGPSIMLLASARFAGMIKNTTITTAMLSAVGRTIESTEPHIMSTLRLVDPITKSLFCNKDYEKHDVKLLLEQLRETGAHLKEAGAVH